MKSVNLEGDAKFLFFTMMQAAIRMKEMGKQEKDFLEFAKGIWESLELNNVNNLQQILHEAMMGEISEFVKNNDSE